MIYMSVQGCRERTESAAWRSLACSILLQSSSNHLSLRSLCSTVCWKSSFSNREYIFVIKGCLLSWGQYWLGTYQTVILKSVSRALRAHCGAGGCCLWIFIHIPWCDILVTVLTSTLHLNHLSNWNGNAVPTYISYIVACFLENTLSRVVEK